MVCDYEYDRTTNTMRINCAGCIYGSTLEDSAICMAKTIEKFAELKRPAKIVFSGTRNVEYDENIGKLLLELALLIEKIESRKLLTLNNLCINTCGKHVQIRYKFVQKFLLLLKYDPIEAYKILKREIRHAKLALKKEYDTCTKHYLDVLISVKSLIESTSLIKSAIPIITDHKNRSLYRILLTPITRPSFMSTKYFITPPQNVELIDRYKISNVEVSIYALKDKIRKFYFISPPEFNLEDVEYEILEQARTYIGRHEPAEMELALPETIRENIYRIGIDMIKDIARIKKIQLTEKKIKILADILARYTAGFGILEPFLNDENVEDININSPISTTPIYIVHSIYEECESNIIPSIEDAESWATRLRLLSGRPLDEANPVLDTELIVPGGRARIAAITRTLSPDGLGFAIRRHRDKPWTFPLMIANKMFSPLAAGLLWFLIDGGRCILIGGTRGAGKTSLLNALMLQIMPRLRIITVEDTLELNVNFMRGLGFNIERLKSRSVITRVKTELPAEEALRTALRLGDSCLIIGEVRSKEAVALYEAMRIGALANVVAGTIHGASAYAIFDRVVNDLGVPKTSFKATDIVLICNRLKTPDGLSSFRRVTEITEVRKHWQEDPLEENGFVNLMDYASVSDELKPTKTLLTGESVVLNEIANNIKQWKGRWGDVWDNILLRAKILETLVNIGKKKPDILEAENVVFSNNVYYLTSREVYDELGKMDSDLIFERWLLKIKRFFKL